MHQMKMLYLRILQRQPVLKYVKPIVSSTQVRNTSSSTSGSSEDDDKDRKKNSLEARDKLKLLLTKMVEEKSSATKSDATTNLKLAKPVDRRKKTKKAKEKLEYVDPEKQIIQAAAEVAKVVGGDVKQTESELLQKLLNPIKVEAPVETTSNDLNELFKDMKIDRTSKSNEAISRAQQVRQLLKATESFGRKMGVKKSGFRAPEAQNNTLDRIVEERVQLFGNERLGIFPSTDEVNAWPEQDLNQTWNDFEERELRLATIHPPANYFQEMIQWTECGKVWRFPIDNEQDMQTEKSVDFSEHVFLEKHIESWCPPRGPIRHFMELVLVGISKNPYLTVEHKKEHIEWFKNYFNEKKALLQEVEAIPSDFEFIKEEQKKLQP